MTSKITSRSGFFITKSFLSVICLFSVLILVSSSLIVSYFATQNSYNQIVFCQIVRPENTDNFSIKINTIQNQSVLPTEKSDSFLPLEFSLNIKTDRISSQYDAEFSIKLQNLKSNCRQISFKIPIDKPRKYKSSVFCNSNKLVIESEIFDQETGNYIINLVENLIENSQLAISLKATKKYYSVSGQNLLNKYELLDR